MFTSDICGTDVIQPPDHVQIYDNKLFEKGVTFVKLLLIKESIILSLLGILTT